ncbi:hypothetical protein GCM10009827_014450 [Dactylosporangium maewongense]|uniref:Uncharacterized protein n=1 Tax=Dactylosporangium maewongense TaxID=634393 RepID=A0ABN1ZRU7_9ACTN
MTPRRAGWTVAGIVAVGLIAGAVELVVDDSYRDAALALVAGLIAGAVGALTVSLVPGSDLRGLVLGAVFAVQGVLSWTYTNTGAVVWGLLLLSGLLLLFWFRPVSFLAVRSGAAWLGVSYLIIGALGAALVFKPEIAVQRTLYAGYFGLVVLAVFAFRGSFARLTLGIAVAFLGTVAVLLAAGSGNLFTSPHVVPDTPWGRGFEYRFWGASWLLDHPNAMACIAVLAAIRIGADTGVAAWQRIGSVATAALVLCASDSRTGFLLMAIATLAFIWYGRRLTLVPAAALGLVLLVNGPSFLVKERYGDDAGVSSGRVETWRQVGTDWRHDSRTEQLLGNTRDARATVYRASSGADIKLTVDNAPIAALRKAGVAGVAAFLAGLGLLLWNVWRRRRDADPWLVVLLPGALFTMITNEWLIGGTGGTLWLLLLAGEAALLLGPVSPPSAPASRP